ncbi:hypothetical protein CYMTET_21151 [Cymbomonas tetramitiformis]|uniref:EGF-like domain-containing protein n=1 Tax=Cymbomonas tetramitiformis TaxID=36881 RepID=A0AAE0G2N0_9CHLO|nr:hypothetical protein CYMTET_21151 [Cymbomonas tetramitiformis]
MCSAPTSCPQGYSGDGSHCEDSDECSVNNGDCDYRTTCSNTKGGYECGACPSGYLGSGATGCILSTTCEVDNGGCHDTVTCSEGNDGEVVCGDCGEGYTGTGATGCMDEDGCAEMQCYEDVHCEDVRAPGTGATCGECPAGMIGDGVLCEENPCWSFNGGCDLQVVCAADPEAPMGRVCGGCPAGYSDVYGDGTECLQTDGCTPSPCYPGVLCTDIPAPGDGASCGECPQGWTGDGAVCADVDECASGDAAACDSLTACVNTLGKYECTACPEGYKGSGLVGCVPSTDCADNNGGCDLLAACTQDGGLTVCGACPEGYSGSGDTGCLDSDGCADAPCFQDSYGSAAQCYDVAAPGEGHTCGECPEGYVGNGTVCEACAMTVEIVDSSVVDGVVFSSQEVQIVGKIGEVPAECTNTGGLEFEWVGSNSASETLQLTAGTNRAHTLTLRLPAGSLAARTSYTVELTARMADAGHVRASTHLALYVDEEPLQALVRGGGASIGEENLLVLDASVSHDPASDPAPFVFDWQCTLSSGDRCRQLDGTLLPSTLAEPSLEVYLQGEEAGREHTFKLTASKGARSSVAYTTVVVTKGAPPVPVITPLAGKLDAGNKLTLQGSVSTGPSESPASNRSSSGASGEVRLLWSVEAVEGTGAAEVDLNSEEVRASATRGGATLVLHPGVLSEGGRYSFRLDAERQGDSTGSARLEVDVNSPPRTGRLEVSPAEGAALQTIFTLNASGWVDEDLPLAAAFSYRVIGGNTSAERVSLSSVSPQLVTPGNLCFMRAPRTHACSSVVEMTLPEGGLEEHGSLVEVSVRVEDRYGCAAALEARNITVRAPTFDDEDAKLDYVDGVVGESEALLVNGRAAEAVNSVTGSASLLSTSESARSDDLEEGSRAVQRSGSTAAFQQSEMKHAEADLPSNATLQRQRQRESMMAVTVAAHGMLTPSPTVQSWVAGVVQALVACPVEETSSAMRQQVLDLYQSLVEMAMTEGSGASMTVDLAQQILEGLSSIILGLEMDGATASSFVVLQGVADALLLQLSAGEQPAEAASEQLQLRVQRDSLAAVGGTSDRLLESLVTTPGDAPTTLLLPAALHQSLQTQAGEEVATRLLVSRPDPHSNRSDLASWQTNSTVCDDAWCHRVASAVTSVALLHANGTEVAVTDLEDPIRLNLTVAGTLEHGQNGANSSSTTAVNTPLRCAFWDANEMHYSSYGCVNLPNPAPRNATLYWRNQSAWGKPDADVENSTWLFAHSQYWGIQHPWLLDGCDQRDTPTEDLMASNGAADHTSETSTDTSAACAVLSSNNSAGCTWSEVLQGFVGPGCECDPPTTSPTSSGADEDIEHLVDSSKTESGAQNPDAPIPVEESEQSSDDDAEENEGATSESSLWNGRDARSMLHKYAMHVSVMAVLIALSCMVFVMGRHLHRSSGAPDHAIFDTICEDLQSTPSFAEQLNRATQAVSARTLEHKSGIDADSRDRLVTADINIGDDELSGSVVPSTACLPAPTMGTSVEHSPHPEPGTCHLPRTRSRVSLQGAQAKANASSPQCTLPRSSDADVCVPEEVFKSSKGHLKVLADAAQHVDAVGIEMPVDIWGGAMDFDGFSDIESYESESMVSAGETYSWISGVQEFDMAVASPRGAFEVFKIKRFAGWVWSS